MNLDAGNLIAILIGTLTQIGVLMSFRVSLENRLTRIETRLGMDD
jgi:hypothetical protein